MTRQAIIEYCLTFPAVYEDYPFAEIGGDDSAVFRYRDNKKSFALVMHHDGKLYLNLKCDPLEADFLRQAFRSNVAPCTATGLRCITPTTTRSCRRARQTDGIGRIKL